jgi:integrase
MPNTPNLPRRTPDKSLTATAINAMKPGQLLSDGAISPGYGRLKLRRRATRSGSVCEWLFIYQSKATNRPATMTLSRYSSTEQAGHLTIAEARAHARKLQADVKNGIEPAMQRELDKATNQKAQLAALAKLHEGEQKTLKALMDTYVDSLRARNKFDSAYDVENMVENHIAKPFPELSSLPAAEVTARHVALILGRLVGPAVAVKKGRTALKLRSYMAAAFKLALGAELDPMAPLSAAGFDVQVNPAASVPPTKMAAHFQQPGQRTLTTAEFRCYLNKLDAIASPMHRLALELQVMSGGQRFAQLLRLTGADVSDETFTLYDPKGKRAQPRAHMLPLLPELRERIEKLQALSPVTDRNREGIFLQAPAALK